MNGYNEEKPVRQEELKHNDELIAEFMGIRHRRTVGPLSGELYIEVKQTQNANWQTAHYDTSWDWIMPVVERMFDLWKSAETDGFQARLNIKLHKFRRENEIFSHLQQVCSNVCKFIKWYNEDKAA